MKVIASGFDPFHTHRLNPSQLAVEQLPSRVKIDEVDSSVALETIVLPTCCDNAWDALRPLVDQVAAVEPFFLLLSGLAESRDRFTLERFALNVRHYRTADNGGHMRDEECIEDGPDALRTGLPLRELNDFLKERGIPCDISNHAGTFICNEVYYRSLHRWRSHLNCRGILFVHVPPFDKYYRTLNKKQPQQSRAARAYAAVLCEVIKFNYFRSG